MQLTLRAPSRLGSKYFSEYKSMFRSITSCLNFYELDPAPAFVVTLAVDADECQPNCYLVVTYASHIFSLLLSGSDGWRCFVAPVSEVQVPKFQSSLLSAGRTLTACGAGRSQCLQSPVACTVPRRELALSCSIASHFCFSYSKTLSWVPWQHQVKEYPWEFPCQPMT